MTAGIMRTNKTTKARRKGRNAIETWYRRFLATHKSFGMLIERLIRLATLLSLAPALYELPSALYNLWQWIFQLWVHVIRQKARREYEKSKGENFPFIRQIKFAKAKKAFHLNKHNPCESYVLKISRLMSRWEGRNFTQFREIWPIFVLLLFFTPRSHPRH